MRGRIHIKTFLKKALDEWHGPPDRVLKLFDDLHDGHKEYVFERILNTILEMVDGEWSSMDHCYVGTEAHQCPIIVYLSRLSKEGVK